MILVWTAPLASSAARIAPPAVHHAAGGNHVGPRRRVAHGLASEQFQRGIVVHVGAAAALGQHAAVAVVGVLAEADVGDRQQFGRRVFDCPQRLLHDAAVAQRVAADVVLLSRDAEQNDPPQPQPHSLPGFLGRHVRRQPAMARQ
jgi:hypothetical protein